MAGVVLQLNFCAKNSPFTNGKQLSTSVTYSAQF
jgi:hypothetical protein